MTRNFKQFLKEQKESLNESPILGEPQTGVHTDIYVSKDGKNVKQHHIPRIKFTDDHNERIPVGIDDEKDVVINKTIDKLSSNSKKLLKTVKEWVKINQECLLKFWNDQNYSFQDLKKELKKWYKNS